MIKSRFNFGAWLFSGAEVQNKLQRTLKSQCSSIPLLELYSACYANNNPYLPELTRTQ